MAANTRFETLLDVTKHGANIEVLCLRCRHRGVIDGAKLARWFACHGWTTRLHQIGERLKCSHCTVKRLEIRPTAKAPTGPEWGPRTEVDWERLVKRLRD